MKTKNNKAVVVLMTAALLLTSLLPSGCVSRKNCRVQIMGKGPYARYCVCKTYQNIKLQKAYVFR